MADTFAARALSDAVNVVSSRRIKSTQSPAPAYSPKPRQDGPIRLNPAKTPVLGPIGKAGAALRAGELSCKELLESCLGAVERDNPRLNCLVQVTEALARAQSDLLDEELATGGDRGALHGIPLSVTDLLDVSGVPTRAGSVTYDIVPEEDAGAVKLVRDAGAVILGKAATSEFALGVTPPNARNPHDPARIPGGSSGGAAIAVLAGMGFASLGTDTRSSVRSSAALCGVVGFKPTFGSVPAGGTVQVSWSMDHIAPVAASVADAALLVDVLTGSQVAAFAGADVSALRVGLPPDGTANVDYGVLALFQSAMQVITKVAGQVTEVARPSTLDFSTADAAGLVVSRCEAASFHRRMGLDRSKSTPEVREQLDSADLVAATDYLDAQRLRSMLAGTMLKVFEDLDVLVMPTCLVPAPLIEEAGDHLLLLARNAVMWSLLGFPAITVPCGRTAAGLPVGLQIVAPPSEEASLVALGSAFELAR
ncbi:MAG TPA: amidase [Actinomycetota bacterium]|nr:amidase [Actinomycetota bacterium]